MFIIIPLLLILVSAIGIAVIVYRKLPYLKKLTPESHELSEHIWDDLFPELMAWFDQDSLKGYQQKLLREVEKLVRRTRLVFLRVDHLSERLIKRIRRSHVEANISRVEATDDTPVESMARVSEEQLSPHVTVLPKTEAEKLREELKQEEQNLIIEIAQNPKDSALYEKLGDLYVKMESFGDAKDSYEAALELKPTDDGLARKYSQVLRSVAHHGTVEAKA